jgi:DNA repair exonuclease SbcCD ATPase subunit
MSIDTIFWTQIGSVFTFLIALFFLYRLLVEQKDAVIQLLKERISILNDQLAEAQSNSPDILAKSLHDRTKILESELSRLSSDQGSSVESINRKEAELAAANERLEELNRQVELAKELLVDFTCPHCGAPMSRRDFGSESVEHQGHDYDVDHEYSEYECGYSLVDGKQDSPCRQTNTNGKMRT